MSAAKQTFWLAVACANHVERGRAGFMQVCHGKGGPLRKISPGDGVVYYSPSRAMTVKDGYQSFTAIRVAMDHVPYQADMGGGFMPFRRDVRWRASRPAPLKALSAVLDLTKPPNWGYALRRGLLPLTAHDYAMIAKAMAPG